MAGAHRGLPTTSSLWPLLAGNDRCPILVADTLASTPPWPTLPHNTSPATGALHEVKPHTLYHWSMPFATRVQLINRRAVHHDPIFGRSIRQARTPPDEFSSAMSF
jgi:hypothetical protein